MADGLDLTAALRLRLERGAPEVVALVGGGGKSRAAFTLADEARMRGRRAVVTATTMMGADEVAHPPTRSGPLPVVESSGAVLPLADVARALDQQGACLLVGPVQGDKRRGVDVQVVDALAAAGRQLGLDLVAVEADGSRKLPVKAPAAHEPVLPTGTTLLAPVAGVDALGRRMVEGQVHRPELMRALLGLPEGARLTPAQLAQLMLDPRGGDKGRPPGARRVALLNKVSRPDQAALARLVAARWITASASGLLADLGREDGPPVRERWAPLAAVVLAAGRAQRMGRAKQLIELDGEPLVCRALAIALASGVQQVVLVTGAYAAEVTAAVASLAQRQSNLQIVYNPAWATGQASSMQAGLAALSPAVEAVTFLPVDQPFVPPLLLRRLVQCWRSGADLAAPTVDGERRGAPALFDRSLWPELMAVTGDTGGRSLLRRHADHIQSVAAAAEWLRDLDTPEDLG